MLPLNDSSKHWTYQLRSAKQIKYQDQVGSHSYNYILTTISHNELTRTKSESTLECCISQLQNQAQCHIHNRTDPTHSKNISVTYLPYIQLSPVAKNRMQVDP